MHLTSKLTKWAVLIVTGVVIFLVMECRVEHYKAQASLSQSAVEHYQLEAAGLQKALLAKPKTIVEKVPQLITKEIERLVKERAVEPVESVRVETVVKTVEVPTGCGDEPSYPIQTSFDLSLLVGVSNDLTPWTTGKETITLSGPRWERKVPFELPKDAPTMEVMLSRTIMDDVRFTREYDRVHVLPTHPRYWRFGPVVGVGGVYTTQRDFEAGLFVGWGLSF